MRDLAIITGASRGIGRSIYNVLKETYQVVGVSREGDAPCDFSDPSQIPGMFEKINRVCGSPKVLINCAGYVEPKGIQEVELSDLLTTINVNLTSLILCTREFVKYNEGGGKIINIASTSGQRPSPGWSVYAAAKAGVINFSLTMAEELKPYNIQVYCISPGRCATELRRRLAPEEDQTKIMQPEEVAEFVQYLLEEPGLLSNQVITLKKGLIM